MDHKAGVCVVKLRIGTASLQLVQVLADQLLGPLKLVNLLLALQLFLLGFLEEKGAVVQGLCEILFAALLPLLHAGFSFSLGLLEGLLEAIDKDLQDDLGLRADLVSRVHLFIGEGLVQGVNYLERNAGQMFDLVSVRLVCLFPLVG